MNLPDFPGFLWFLFTAISAGFIWLLWRLLRDVTEGINKLRDEITRLKDELVRTREQFADKYRTKEEACRDWINLKETLDSMKSLDTRVTRLEMQK